MPPVGRQNIGRRTRNASRFRNLLKNETEEQRVQRLEANRIRISQARSFKKQTMAARSSPSQLVMDEVELEFESIIKIEFVKEELDDEPVFQNGLAVATGVENLTETEDLWSADKDDVKPPIAIGLSNNDLSETVVEDKRKIDSTNVKPTDAIDPLASTLRRSSEVSINRVFSHTSHEKETAINHTNHLQTDTEKKCFDVIKSSFTGNSNHSLGMKIGNKDTRDESHRCKICKKAFAQSSNLSIHMRTHTGEKPYCCDICKKTFSQSSTLSNHMRTHTGEKPFCCDVCKMTFAQKSNLLIHMRTHTGDKPYSCEICKTTFSLRSTLSRHLGTHAGEKPFGCDVCKKTFAHGSSLSIHMRIHTGEKPYCCDICKRTFSQRSTLSSHMRSHTGVKPYCCDICKMTFVGKSTLSIHMRTHTGEKPYSCDVCKKTFVRRTALSIHMRTHTGEKPYCCDVCKKTFAQRSTLSIHMRTQH